jgi:hypothetical protein
VPPRVTLCSSEQSSPTVAVSPITMPVAWSMNMPCVPRVTRRIERLILVVLKKG